MFTVRELKALVGRLKAEQFEAQLGPFVLIQKPDKTTDTDTHKMGLPANVQRTTVASAEKVSNGALTLLFDFDELAVASLPPMTGDAVLTVGRQPDNELVLDHPSVSKRHATLRWDAANVRCSVVDEGSTNGTFLNAATRLRRETLLRDGDILSFGEVQYWFLLTPTLHKRLLARPVSPGV